MFDFTAQNGEIIYYILAALLLSEHTPTLSHSHDIYIYLSPSHYPVISWVGNRKRTSRHTRRKMSGMPPASLKFN